MADEGGLIPPIVISIIVNEEKADAALGEFQARIDEVAGNIDGSTRDITASFDTQAEAAAKAAQSAVASAGEQAGAYDRVTASYARVAEAADLSAGDVRVAADAQVAAADRAAAAAGAAADVQVGAQARMAEAADASTADQVAASDALIAKSGELDAARGSVLASSKGLVGGFGNELLGALGLGYGIDKAVKAWDSFDQAQTQLQVAVKNSGDAWDAYLPKLNAAYAAGQQLGFDNADVASSLQQLTTATNDPAKAMSYLGTAEDLARMKNETLSAAAQTLTRVMAGSNRAITQMGLNLDIGSAKLSSIRTATEAVTTDQSALASVQDAVSSGQLTGVSAASELTAAHLKLSTAEKNLGIDQKTLATIMDAVAQRTEGASQAFAGTFPGQVKILEANLNHLARTVGEALVPALDDVIKPIESVLSWFDQNETATKALADVIIGVLMTAITIFVSKGVALLITGTEDMVVGISKAGAALTGGLIPALERTEPGITGIGVAATDTAGVVATATGEMDASMAGFESTVVAANEAAGASFTALLGPIALAVAALEGYNAIASNPQAAGAKAVHGLQSASGHALSQGQLTGLLASTGAIGSTGKHGLYPWSEDDTSLIQSADKALKSFAGSGNQTLLDGIMKRADALKKEWPQNASALNTLIGVMRKAKSEGAVALSRASSGTGTRNGDGPNSPLVKTLGRLADSHKKAMDDLTKRLEAIHQHALLIEQLQQSAALAEQATQTTAQTKIMSDAAAAQVTIVKDQQALVSEATQAQTKSVADMAAVVSAKMTAAATAITDASAVAHDQASTIVTGMQDATQVQADILGERLLYGYQLVAQRLQVQEDIAKEGFDRQIAIAQEHLDEDKQHWDGKIAAMQIDVARVTQHQDQLVAIAQQRATQVQLREDTALRNATEAADTASLAATMRTALAQTAVTLSASAKPAQVAAAAQALTAAQAGAGLSTANAAKALQTVTDNANKAITNSAGAYQQAQDVAGLAEAKVQAALTGAQGQASKAEARDQAQLTRLQDQAAKVEQRLQDAITLAQAGGGRRIQSDAKALANTPGDNGPLAVGSETGRRHGKRDGGVNIEGGIHIHGPNMTAAQTMNELSLALRSLATAPPF